MSLGEILYLAMVLSAFAAFSITLASVVRAHDRARPGTSHEGESTGRGLRSGPIAT
jgi:hypothetical protein